MKPPSDTAHRRLSSSSLRDALLGFGDCSAPSVPAIHFDITVLGSLGGPLDGQTCSYLIKTSDVSYADIVVGPLGGPYDAASPVLCVDAGCGLAGVNDVILEENRCLFGPSRVFSSSSPLQTMVDHSYNHNALLRSYRDSMHILDYTSCELALFSVDCGALNLSSYQASARIVDSIAGYLVTHPHLDHIAGLVINSAGFDGKARPKRIYGSRFTLEALRKHVFNGIIWPNLQCGGNGDFLRLIPIGTDSSTGSSTDSSPTDSSTDSSTGRGTDGSPEIVRLNEHYAVRAFSVSHGVVADGGAQQRRRRSYVSSSFLFKSLRSHRYLLVFGDVETSSSNRQVWDAAAPLVLRRRLAGIVIECSTRNVPVNTPLFGHLTPSHLFNELVYLANRVRLLGVEHAESTPDASLERPFDPRKPLHGLHLIVTHIKEDASSGMDPRRIILAQLNTLNAKYGLGCSFTIAFPGLTYSV